MSTSARFEKLFQPIRLGTMEVKNRFVMAPMLTNRATKDGLVTEQTKAHYDTRARGGVGLIIVEEACIDAPQGKGGALQLYIDDDRQIPGLSELAGTIQICPENSRSPR
jgi:2,4-dienoyl-CoA reductase-like NADH-dependent reductase (Old Yellow Enzyme family)